MAKYHGLIILRGAGVGALSSLPVMFLAFLGQALAGFTFIPYDIFDWLTRVLPGPFVGASVEFLVRLVSTLRVGPTDRVVKNIEHAIAVVLFIVMGTVYGAAVGWLTYNSARFARAWGWLGGGFLMGVWLAVESALGFTRASSGAIVVGSIFLCLGWGWVMGAWAHLETRWDNPVGPRAIPSRRRFFIYLAANTLAVVLSLVGILQYELKHEGPAASTAPTVSPGPKLANTPAAAMQGSLISAPPTPPPLSADGVSSSAEARGADGRVLAAPGTRPELTSTDQFYRVSINSSPPKADPNLWRLSLDGLVDRSLLLSLDDIHAFPAVMQVATFSCISNPVGGDLISTARWTGIRLKDLLDQAGVKPGAKFINIEAFDEYYESASLEEASDARTLLIYAMNGAPLNAEHGFPLRIFIPNHYGMKQPKWISHLALIRQSGPGYWSDRKWDTAALVNTTAVIDAVSVSDIDPLTRTIPVGGMAYAGGRGIQKVEFQVDDGEWTPVTLRVPPLSEFSWVQWRTNTPYLSGRHIFRVRATDGTGALQTNASAGSFPRGATGIFSYQVDL